MLKVTGEEDIICGSTEKQIKREENMLHTLWFIFYIKKNQVNFYLIRRRFLL